MHPDFTWELRSETQLNPSSRPPPRVYQRSQQSEASGDVRMRVRDLVLTIVAISTALGFATLCAVIA
jgi:hypothetical protein